MTNANDYISWRGDLSFEASPINEIDLFIFSQLATPNYKGIIDESGVKTDLTDAAVEYFRTHSASVQNLGSLQSHSVLPMFKNIAGSHRYSGIKFFGYRNIVSNEESLQFSVISMDVPYAGTVVAFRGTDDSIVGWKEDFNLAVKDAVPAQKEALEYLKKTAARTEGDIYICGHSKGGNLAIFSAVKAAEDPEIEKRIKKVISFDGPGFMKKFFESPQYGTMKDRITTITSKNGLVGMIMDYAGTLSIVNTQTTGPMAHDGFTWEVMGAHFVREKEMSDRSKAFHNAIKDLFEKMPPAEAEKAFESMFAILTSTGADTITDLKSKKAAELSEIVRGLNTNKEVSEFNLQLMRNIVKSYVDLEWDELKAAINDIGDKIGKPQ